MAQAAEKIENTLETGSSAPDFSIPNEADETISLSALQGKNVVLYFYPKDDTPGCTAEAKDFRDHIDAFQAANTVIIGVSKDSSARHEKFIGKYCLPFSLGADTEGEVCEAYGVWVEKSMYGKKYMGIERATYLIDAEGIIRRIWRKVKVKNHVSEVLEAAQSL